MVGLSLLVAGGDTGEIGRLLASETGLGGARALLVPLTCIGAWLIARETFACHRCIAVWLYRTTLTPAFIAWVAEMPLFMARHSPYQYIQVWGGNIPGLRDFSGSFWGELAVGRCLWGGSV